jgi:hypothetical protein
MHAGLNGHTAVVTALLAVPGIDVNAKDIVRSNYLCKSLPLSRLLTRRFPLAPSNDTTRVLIDSWRTRR